MRTLSALTLLLVLGACGSGPTVSSGPGEPETGARWHRVVDGPLSARHDPVGAWVDDRFVLVGGVPGPPCPASADCAADPAPLRDGATYSPGNRSWTGIADAPDEVAATVGPSAVVGSVLYVRSASGLLAYDVERDAWTRVPAPPTPFDHLTAAGDRLVAFGDGTGGASVLDQAVGRWLRLPPDPLRRVVDRWWVWTGDRLMVAGHADVPEDRPPLVRIAFLDAELSGWGRVRETDLVGWAPVAVAGRVVWPSTQSLDGGQVNGWGRSYPEGGILDPSSGEMAPMPKPPSGEGGTCCAVTTQRYADVYGHLLDPVRRTWLDVPGIPGGSRTGGSYVGGAGTVLVWGGAPTGREGEGSRNDGYLLDLSGQ
jgi:hypothetical protein